MIETRMQPQTKLWKLSLNPMRSNTETTEMVAWSDDKQKLIDWYNSQVESSVSTGSPSFECHGESHTWHKTFRVGGPLEWYNPTNITQLNQYRQGISSEWVDDKILPTITLLKV